MIEHARIIKEEVLSDNWSNLKKVTFEYQKDGIWKYHTREAYAHGDGAAILLYNPQKKSVILTRQFRLPTFVNGNKDGLMIEVCAGLLDSDSPETAIRRETEEETGYKIKEVKKIFDAYMTPGSVTEILYFFTAEYGEADKISEGGGVEGEDIEVLEWPFEKALAMIDTGEIKDAKTIMLLYHARVKHLMME